MRLTDSRYEEIKQLITDLLCDYSISTLPIDVFLLAQKMAIKVYKYSEFIVDERIKIISASQDGMSCYITDTMSYIILYNDEMDSNRIRFTIAHEIGHIVLGHEYSCEETESEADYFARNLLVPMGILIHRHISDYIEIVNMFEVSYTVAGNVIRTLTIRLECGYGNLTDYEIELLKLFNLL
jgi:Zn-dependent peptidase ImmA (M78 family)